MSADYRRTQPLSPRQIREYELPYLGRTRRGLDPEAVYRLLYRLADQVARQNAATRAISDENHRIKQALHRWQSTVARQAQPPQNRPPEAAF